MTPGEKFAARCEAVAVQLGLMFAGQPDARIAASLDQMRQNLNAEFIQLWPLIAPDDLAAGVDSIIRRIQNRRREIGEPAQVVN